ncbi:MOSC domain-containing protein [Aquibacillus salsiterrae]|uniref:MOSC domain-containing protein n=1 Tax=Aquibacillus salsiterrae TaxID=2950439 RepID=A0A9X4AFQ7_9BACI|nr:MOSC domain-containing protein [Aquibacillus salsiterrae]MDC3418166.1 MOSC domain-containing protein [Aquibacillus salsiterrae]
MKYAIYALSAGKPTTHVLNGKELHTGFIKEQMQSDWLSKTGFTKDGQADTKNHGGEDKALLMYPFDHYHYWETRFKQPFKVPSFGENITISGLTEKDVCIGDIYKLGHATIQVSQPRQPCYKIADVHSIKNIPAVVTETGYTGYYFRVLEEGNVTNSDQLQLIDQKKQQVSIAFIHRILFHDRNNAKGIEVILNVDELASSLRESLTKKLATLTGNNG